MQAKDVILQFYQAFQQKDANAMGQLYADQAQFEDPGFGRLNASQARAMWKMLVERGGEELVIEFKNLQTQGNKASIDWVAHYSFGPKKRKVLNRIHAEMLIEKGKIIKHKDTFSFWKWSSMALGLPGQLLGWTPYLRKQVQQRSRGLLERYMNKK